jgi:valyl-tRNA synthetase
MESTTNKGPSPAPEANDQENEGLSKNQAKNEAKRKAKMEKFLAKQSKQTTAATPDNNVAPAAKKEKPAPAKKTEKPVEPLYQNTTPAGCKKDMTQPMASSYSPRAVESAWNSWWEKQGYHKPKLQPDGSASPKGTYVIPIPPPNVTGSLHLGHALTVSIQDTLIRWNRMLGKTVLYNPGCDHAGIATQSVVEKRIWKESKITRHDLGREQFLEKVWEWKEMYGNRIYTQLRRLGTSGDWDRACFTMDPVRVVRIYCLFGFILCYGIVMAMLFSSRVICTLYHLKLSRNGLTFVMIDGNLCASL